MAWTLEVLRGIDTKIAEGQHQQDIQFLKMHYRLQAIEDRLTGFSIRLDAIEKAKTQAPDLGIKAAINSLWVKASIILILMYANISFEQSTKILSAVRRML